jgi:MoxR-like ATPase
MFKNVEDVRTKLSHCGYITEYKMELSIFLADKLSKPLLVEGPAGVGKTELGRVIAKALNTPLIRLQCYEGLDEAKALYEWNYQKQLLRIQSTKKDEKSFWEKIQEDIYTEDYLLPRPILKAFTSDERVTLLIDELDKSDEEFESFLLEAFSDYQVTIPEYGTVTAKNKPLIVITSNNNRSLSDALKRRCLHLYIDYPDFEREMEILKLKVPGIDHKLKKEIVKFVQSTREMDLKKAPSISETIDWAKSLLLLGVDSLDKEIVLGTLNVLLKYHSDIKQVEKRLANLLPG